MRFLSPRGWATFAWQSDYGQFYLVDPAAGFAETTEALFPSRRFSISSPSMPHPLPAGPAFLLEAGSMAVRIGWMKFQGSRDDNVPVEPDVIAIALWPCP